MKAESPGGFTNCVPCQGPDWQKRKEAGLDSLTLCLSRGLCLHGWGLKQELTFSDMLKGNIQASGGLRKMSASCIKLHTAEV